MKRPSTLSVLTGILCLQPCATQAGTFTPQQAAQASADRSPLTVEVRPGHVEFYAVGWPSALTIRGKGDGLEGRLRSTAPPSAAR